MNTEEKITRLQAFKETTRVYDRERLGLEEKQSLRSRISQEMPWVRQQVIEAGCFHTMTICPPPAVGGLIMNNIDPFQMIFDRPFLKSLVPYVTDMIDHAIGVLKAEPEEIKEPTLSVVIEDTVKNYAFVAMPMDKEAPELVDVLEAIKEGSSRCGVQAERVDEPESNQRITDRVIESIHKAEFVIVDLTKQKPNVYWEAGFAHGLGKVPIYIARHGTHIEFDLKDYPIIFFKNYKDLKDSLEKRLRGLAEKESP